MLAADAVAVEIDYGHGRIEQRRCSVIADLSLVEKAAEWASLQGLVRVESERHHKATGKIESEIRYYITSVVRHTDGHLFRTARARVTFSRMSVALAVQMKGLGF